VADGLNALAQLAAARREACPYDVVLVDSYMPDMDGLTLARTIKADPSLAAVSLVSLTPFGQHTPGVEELRELCAAHLTRPVRQSRLYECLVAVRERPVGAMPSMAPSPAAVCPQLGATVLVVEDNIVNQQVLVRMLQRYGCRVDVAVNGREAVQAAAQLAYDCLFMDCQMPEIDGYTATTMIRRQQGMTGHHVPIIAMTARAMPGDREHCLAAGMDDYIAKPVQSEDLITVLQKWTVCPAHALVNHG
jgi:CheY-like chemotaxis protein